MHLLAGLTTAAEEESEMKTWSTTRIVAVLSFVFLTEVSLVRKLFLLV